MKNELRVAQNLKRLKTRQKLEQLGETLEDERREMRGREEAEGEQRQGAWASCWLGRGIDSAAKPHCGAIAHEPHHQVLGKEENFY